MELSSACDDHHLQKNNGQNDNNSGKTCKNNTKTEKEVGGAGEKL